MNGTHPLPLGGVRQWISLRGRPGAPMLLYLHGGPGFAELGTMSAFADPLLPRFQLVGWDQRGAGRSAAEDVTMDRLLDDLVELVAHLRRERRPPSIVLVGHSWGALLGLLALRREPDLADGVVAIGPLVAGVANEVESHRLASAVARGRGAVLLERLLRREPPPYGDRGGAVLRKTAYLWALGGLLRPRRRAWPLLAALATFPGYSLTDKLLYASRAAHAASSLQPEIERVDLLAESRPLRVPVLVCVGGHDLVTPPSLARALYESLEAPQREWARFDGAAHSLHYEDPSAFAAALVDWHRRAVGPPATVPDDRPDVVRERVLRLGWNATAYQVLAPGLEHWLPPGREAVVGFVRHAGVRVVAGVPVASATDLPAVAQAFEQEARRQGETVCWFGAEARLAGALAELPDHATLPLGAQPVWDPQDWTRVVRDHRSVRSQLNRARNKGVRVEPWCDPSPARMARLRELQADWLAGKTLPRLHFLTQPDTFRFLDDRRLLVATVAGEPVGFLVASPVPARDGWLVEQVVRNRAAPNGTAEALIDAMMRTAADDGSRYLTLGLVPLARRPEAPPGDPPTWLRWTLRWARAHGQRFYNFAGLEYFKAKLAPDRWDPVYAVSSERSFSPRTLYAVTGAFSGGSPIAFAARAAARAGRAELRRLGRYVGR